MRLAWLVSLSAAAAAACGGCGDDGSGTPDGEPMDACMVTCVDGPGDVMFTGELVDWDSTPAAFMGVFDAAFTLRAGPPRMATTAPNGRFILQVPAGADWIVDVDAPDTYQDAIYVVPREVLESPMAVHSARTFTATRRDDFYNGMFGAPYDPTRGHVLVYQALDSAAGITLTGETQVISTEDGTTWGAGTEAAYVFYPNIPAGTQTLAGPSNMLGDGPIPVEADKLTFVTTIFALE
jgi:hypothetical protein